MMLHYVILGMVFLAVVIGAVVLIPLFFAQKKEENPNPENSFEVIDDPVRRFIDPDDLQKMCYSACLITGVIGLAAVMLANFIWGVPLVIGLAAVAYHIPKWIIRRKINQRNDEFEFGMLDFTILISNTLRAGIALPSAIEMAIQSIGGAIREEFTIVLREHRLGVDLTESIERLSKRIKSENLQLFSATVCVTMRTGGSMADVLDHVITTIRQRNAFQDRLKTMIAQSEFEAFMISLSPLVAFVLLYMLDNQLMMPMLTTKLGWAAIFVIIVMEVLGYLVLKQVTKVKF